MSPRCLTSAEAEAAAGEALAAGGLLQREAAAVAVRLLLAQLLLALLIVVPALHLLQLPRDPLDLELVLIHLRGRERAREQSVGARGGPGPREGSSRLEQALHSTWHGALYLAPDHGRGPCSALGNTREKVLLNRKPEVPNPKSQTPSVPIAFHAHGKVQGACAICSA